MQAPSIGSNLRNRVARAAALGQRHIPKPQGTLQPRAVAVQAAPPRGQLSNRARTRNSKLISHPFGEPLLRPPPQPVAPSPRPCLEPSDHVGAVVHCPPCKSPLLGVVDAFALRTGRPER